MILYALIARERTVLAEFAQATGNFPTVTRVLLGKIPSVIGVDETMSLNYDAYTFHYIVSNNITYLCMSDDPKAKRVPFAFLNDIKTKALERYGLVTLQSAIAFALNQDFSPILSGRMDAFNTDPSTDRLVGLNQQIEGVREHMIGNIERVLQRGEHIELLVDKTESLSQQAFRFERSSRNLRKAMLMRRLKVYAAIGGLCALVIFLVLVWGCGLDFGKCKAK